MDIAGQLCYNEQNYDRPRRERNVAAMKGTLIVIEGTDGSGKNRDRLSYTRNRSRFCYILFYGDNQIS